MDLETLPLLNRLCQSVHYAQVGDDGDFDRPSGAETAGKAPWWDCPESREDADDDDEEEPAPALKALARKASDASDGHWVTHDGHHIFIAGSGEALYTHAQINEHYREREEPERAAAAHAERPPNGGKAEEAPRARMSAKERATHDALAATPRGKPVAHALELRAGKLNDRIQSGIDAIAKVHGDGDLPKINVDAKVSGAEQGVFHVAERPHEALGIGVKPSGEHPELTFVHEAGHFLDHFGIPGNSGKRNFERDPLMREWLDAVNQSEAGKQLASLAGKSKVRVEVNGKRQDVALNSKAINYLASHEELWARSYAQYIATRSNDPTLRAQLDAKLARQAKAVIPAPAQWAREDFAPIAKAMDGIMNKLGWRA